MKQEIREQAKKYAKQTAWEFDEFIESGKLFFQREDEMRLYD